MASLRQQVKQNFALIVGLTLPVLMMAGFLLTSTLTQSMSDPPRYDVVFSVTDYAGPSQNLPVSVRLLVKDRALVAQYTKVAAVAGGYSNSYWKKLYIYEAGPRKVRELTFGIPPDVEKIAGMREDVVEATKGLRLDTTLQAPDGYQLSYNDRHDGGLFTGLFLGWGNWGEARLKNGSASVALKADGDGQAFYPRNIEFLGWVVPDGVAGEH